MLLGCAAAFFMLGRAQAYLPPTLPVLTLDDGNSFYLFANDQETYDSNLYRLPSSFTNVGTLLAPDASRSDYFNTASLGGVGQWILGRQVVHLNLRADDNRFDRNELLNNVSGDGDLTLDWVLGSRLSGDAGVDYDRALASFAEIRYYGKDVVDTTQYFASGRYQSGPHWALYGGVRQTDYSHSAIAVDYNNLHTKSGFGGVEYATNIDDFFRLEYRYSDAYYPEEIEFNDVSLDRNYHENTERALVKYVLSDKTSIDGYVGYLERDYRDAAIGRFSGDIWNVAFDWHPTDKTDLLLTGWHELQAYTVSEADYFVSRGGSVTPGWQVTEKFKITAGASYERHEYIQSSTSVLTVGARNDKVAGEQLALLYTPRGNLILNFTYRAQQRSSNQALYTYDDKLINIGLTYKFW